MLGFDSRNIAEIAGKNLRNLIASVMPGSQATKDAK